MGTATGIIIKANRAVTTATAVSGNEFLLVDASSGAIPITGPAAATARRWGVKKTDATSNAVTISYVNAGGTTATMALTAQDDAKTFEPVGSGYVATTTDRSRSADDQRYLPRDRVVVTPNGMSAVLKITGASAATAPGFTARSTFTIPESVTNLQVVLPGWYFVGGTTGEAPFGNTVTYKGALEYGGVRYPLYFRGARNATLDSGGTLISDELGIVLPAGATVSVWHLTSVPDSTGNWSNSALNAGPGASSTGDGYAAGDIVDSGTITTATAVTSPLTLLGTPIGTALRRIAGVGDSIMAGVGDSSNASIAQGGTFSWLTRAVAGALPMFRFAVGGDMAVYWAANGAVRSLRRNAFFRGMSSAVINLGTNDLWGLNGISAASAATLQGYITTLVNQLVARGIPKSRIWLCTLIPRTTSTDSWATTANQTVDATNEPKRIAYNEWVRANTLGVNVIELADTVETARNSGFWKPSMPYDGIHPSTAGHTAMAAAVPVSAMSA